MAKIKTIYPPTVPNSLPAFDGKVDDLKFYFKPSVANSYEQIDSLQVSIVRLDTNRTVLNSNIYPYDLMFISKDAISFDPVKKFYYFIIDKSIFKQLDTAYKIQVRAVSTEASSKPQDTSSPAMGSWLKNNLDYFSEWSIVTIVMPITAPDFGIQGLSESSTNGINSSGYNFIGYYEPKDPNKSETLSSYRMNIYTYTDYNDKSTWKLYATSGTKTIGIYEKINISQVFDKDLLQSESYVLTFSVITKNLYSKTKQYIIRGEYPTLELFNTINTKTDKDEGRIEVKVTAKQILMKPDAGTSVEYVADDPTINQYPYIKTSHAIIDGTVESNNNFYMYSEKDKWILQGKTKILTVYDNLKDAYNNPFITVKYDAKEYDDYEYYTRIKFCAFKVDLNGGYYLMDSLGKITQQPSDWEYRIIARKEIVTKVNKVEKVVLSENNVFRTKEVISPKQEYYLFYKENEGLSDFKVIKTYRKN